ncbi:GspH/FimT family pseudopilin [Variovorax paradoxus]|nr:GspH/FimT family pseudopilin [Variovorax paradoxus]
MMVVIAISAILLALAVPSMRQLIENNGVASSVNSLMSAISYVRAEALKRGVTVALCRSTDAESANPPSCNAGAQWESGWIAFVDFDGNGSFDAGTGEVLLRAQGSLAGNGGLTQGETVSSLRFDATGLMKSATSFSFESPSKAPSLNRLICIARTGRVRLVTGAAAAGCSS